MICITMKTWPAWLHHHVMTIMKRVIQHLPCSNESLGCCLLFHSSTLVDSHSNQTTNTTRYAYPIHNPRNHHSSSFSTFAYKEEEEEDVVDHHIHCSGPYIEQKGGTLASWVKSISNNMFGNHSNDEQGRDLEWIQEDSSGKRIVYRDFPRHDGTPCLIYNSPVVREQHRKRIHSVNSLTGSTVWATSNHDNTTSTTEQEEEEEEPVDSFVDRLEQLMVVRHEQYEERRHLEMTKRRSHSSGNVMSSSIQQAEAALDDFLDISMEQEDVGVSHIISPTQQQRQ